MALGGRAGGALGGGGGAEGGGEVDEDFFDAGEGGDGGGDELAEAVFLRGGGGDFDGDVAFGDLDGFDLAEGDEVFEEVGVLDGFEGFEDLLFGDGHGFLRLQRERMKPQRTQRTQRTADGKEPPMDADERRWILILGSASIGVHRRLTL